MKEMDIVGDWFVLRLTVKGVWLTICLDTVLFLIGKPPRRWSTILKERRLVSDLSLQQYF
jgi:hypothetical protein